MASPSAFPTIQEYTCASCNKMESDLSKALKKCAKRHCVFYCGRECQTKHWKVHKIDCSKYAAYKASRVAQHAQQTANEGPPSPSQAQNFPRPAPLPRFVRDTETGKQIDTHIADPSTGKPMEDLRTEYSIDKPQWHLRDRPQKEVVGLLIQTYVWRCHEEFEAGDLEPRGIYAG